MILASVLWKCDKETNYSVLQRYHKDKFLNSQRLSIYFQLKIKHSLLSQISRSGVTKTVQYISYPGDWLLKLTLSI